jgi:hypothetical protein
MKQGAVCGNYLHAFGSGLYDCAKLFDGFDFGALPFGDIHEQIDSTGYSTFGIPNDSRTRDEPETGTIRPLGKIL